MTEQEAQDVQEQEELPAPPQRARRERRGAPWLVVVLSIAFGLICLAAGAAAYLADDPQLAATAQGRASALEAAKQRTLALTTYDHRTLDQDFAGVLETATGEFKADYEETTGQLRQTFEQSSAVAKAQVVGAGLESESIDPDGPDTAVAVVAVDQVITTAGAAPRTERNRLRMTLVRPEGTWLVEKVQRL